MWYALLQVLSSLLSLVFVSFLFVSDKKEKLSLQKMQHSATPNSFDNVQKEEIRKKRAILADAAEKRRYDFNY